MRAFGSATLRPRASISPLARIRAIRCQTVSSSVATTVDEPITDSRSFSSRSTDVRCRLLIAGSRSRRNRRTSAPKVVSGSTIDCWRTFRLASSLAAAFARSTASGSSFPSASRTRNLSDLDR